MPDAEGEEHLFHGVPGGDIAGVDGFDLRACDVGERVARVDDNRDSVNGNDARFQLGFFAVCQFTGGHSDVTVTGGNILHAGGGVGLLDFDRRAGVELHICFGNLLHDRCDRGGTGNGDLALGFGAGKGSGAVGSGNVTVICDYGLAFLAHDIFDEILGKAGGVSFGGDVERAADLVGAGFDVCGGCFGTVYLECLDGIIHRAERNITDRVFITGNIGEHDARFGGDCGFLRGFIHLFAGKILFLNAEQFDERAAGSGAFLTGDDGNVMACFKIGCLSCAAGGLSRAAGRVAPVCAACQCQSEQRGGHCKTYDLFHYNHPFLH